MLPHLPWTLLFLSMGGQCSERLVDVCTSPRVCLSRFDCVSLTFVSPLFKAVGWGEGGRERNLGAVYVCVYEHVRFGDGLFNWPTHSYGTCHAVGSITKSSVAREQQPGELQVHAQVALMLSEVLSQGSRRQGFSFKTLFMNTNGCLTNVKMPQERQICHPQVGFYTGTGGLYTKNL